MQQLLLDMEAIADLSLSETNGLMEAFKSFVHRNIPMHPNRLEEIFNFPATHYLSQQEDEDNLHAELTAASFY
jgi:hypothetical protein